jgi:hypothetical protein
VKPWVEKAVLDLPERCHTVLPGLPAGSNVALCVRGESGVRLTLLDFGPSNDAGAIVRAFNASLGIDVEQEKAMLAGCLFGWEPFMVARTSIRAHAASSLLH